MSPSGIQVNRTFIIVLVGVLAGVVVIYRFWHKTPIVEKPLAQADDKSTSKQNMADKKVSQSLEFKIDEIPAELLKGDQEVKEETIDVKMDEKVIVSINKNDRFVIHLQS